MNPHLLEMKVNNSSIPNSFMTSDDNKSPLMKDEADVTIKHPKFFKISLEKLVAIVLEGEKRTFCEEVDKLESYGRKIILYRLLYSKPFSRKLLPESVKHKLQNGNNSGPRGNKIKGRRIRSQP